MLQGRWSTSVVRVATTAPNPLDTTTYKHSYTSFIRTTLTKLTKVNSPQIVRTKLQ